VLMGRRRPGPQGAGAGGRRRAICQDNCGLQPRLSGGDGRRARPPSAPAVLEALETVCPTPACGQTQGRAVRCEDLPSLFGAGVGVPETQGHPGDLCRNIWSRPASGTCGYRSHRRVGGGLIKMAAREPCGRPHASGCASTSDNLAVPWWTCGHHQHRAMLDCLRETRFRELKWEGEYCDRGGYHPRVVRNVAEMQRAGVGAGIACQAAGVKTTRERARGRRREREREASQAQPNPLRWSPTPAAPGLDMLTVYRPDRRQGTMLYAWIRPRLQC
jgi:hypothetical protein